jgi:formylglycine-generating enzyme required for sulfatase activity
LRTAKEPNRSGRAEHCRSYWGMYDMSGNLWDWTSTPADREGLFLVAGGAWNTQNASSCNETKFSFYPQNEYPFVGFRCCK